MSSHEPAYRFQFAATDLLAFVDETGHDSLGDPAHPVFGLGGCAVRFEDYQRLIDLPWRDIHATHFPDKPYLHASEIDRRSSGIPAIADFFRTKPFFRVAAVVDQKSGTDPSVSTYDRVSALLLSYLHQVAIRASLSRIVLTFESIGAEDAKPSRYLGQQARFVDSSGDYVPVQVFRATKNFGLSGLEVADFIMHAAGCEVRRGRIVPATQRRDFDAVFSGVPDEWVYFGVLAADAEDAKPFPYL